MRITLKLFATLGQFLPADAKANAVQVDVPDTASAHQVLQQFKVRFSDHNRNKQYRTRTGGFSRFASRQGVAFWRS